MIHRRALAIAVIAGIAACSERPASTECPASLTGVWRAPGTTPSGEPWRFHFLDPGGEQASIEIYPMFDDTHPRPDPSDANDDRAVHRAPAVFDIKRTGSSFIGTRTQRFSRQGKTCTIRHQAALRRCQANSVDLSWVPNAHIDWATCKSAGKSRWTTLQLERRD